MYICMLQAKFVEICSLYKTIHMMCISSAEQSPPVWHLERKERSVRQITFVDEINSDRVGGISSR